MSDNEYFKIRDSPSYTVFKYIESYDDDLFMSMESICDKLNSQENKIRELEDNYNKLKQVIIDDFKYKDEWWKRI